MNNDYSELHILQDKSIGLQAVICLHQNNRGPALGGCRFIEYDSLEAAITDATRLSKAMLNKAIMSNLPHDGGKAVIIRRKQMDEKTVLQKFGEFVDSLNGKYITTIDSGTTPDDMSFIRQFTRHVTGEKNPNLPDIAHSTALGVFKGIQAAVKIVYHRENLQGLHVAIQGVGSVGYHLAKILYQHGARLSVCDINPLLAARCTKEFQATAVLSQDMLAIPCHILSPCALGSVITDENHSRICADIIAGAANEQLSLSGIANKLHARGILYLPDFVINAGGLIHLSSLLRGLSLADINRQLDLIYDRVLRLAGDAKLENRTLLEMTNELIKSEASP